MVGKKFSRREFIKASSVGVAGGLISPRLTVESLAGAMRRGDMGGGGGVEVIDPPLGGFLTNPLDMPNFSSTPGLVEVELEAKIAPVDVIGTEK